MTSIKMPDHLLTGRPTAENGNGHHANGALDLELESLVTADESVWDLRTPVVAWLIACVRPDAAVDLDLAGDSTADAVRRSVEHFVPDGQCVCVGRPLNRSAGSVGSGSRHAREFQQALEETPASIDLLHVRLADEAEDNDVSVEGWLDRLQPGSVTVLSWARRDSDWDRCSVWKQVSDRYPLVTVDEANCAFAQVPIDGRAPLVEMLSDHSAARAQLSWLAERGAYRHVTGTPLTPTQLRDEIDRLRTQRVAELEAAREGLSRLRQELAAAIANQKSAEELLAEERRRHADELRATSQRVLDESRAEADALAAKVATSAAKYERKIAEIESAARVREAEFGLQLGAALREVADIRASTSWRVTSGIRALGSTLRRLPRR